MQAGKRELCFERPDQVRSREDDAAAAAGREPDGAGTVATGRGSLEVDRDEGGHRKMRGDDRPPDGSVTLAWAKSPNRPDAVGAGWLSLVDHSTDVALVARALLRLPTVRERLGALAGHPLSTVDISRLCFLVGLHDAGKASHGFQARLRRERPDAGHIAPLWGLLGKRHVHRAHRVLYQQVREALSAPRWRAWFGGPDTERDLWGVILAHHGSLPERTSAVAPDPRLWRRRGGYDPIAALQALADAMVEVFPDAFAAENREPLPASTRFQHAFAGFVTLADWLGSDETVFRFPSDGAPTGVERVAWSRERAADVMRRRWLDPALARDAARRRDLNFATLFPKHPAPRPAQASLLDAPLPRAGQVTILEAETGSGKTEAALIHFLRLFQAGAVDGLYFALPTRAAAVQIHRRIRAVISDWMGVAAPPVGLAVPGYLRVDDDEGQRLPDERGIRWPDDEGRDRGWAVENAKRYLSGMVMVGTIDQLLLGGLCVRHAPFRSGPMLRLLLCVDEVHASDAYMTTLLRVVLEQHRGGGGHALLMSATLGSAARLRLLGGRVEMHEEPDARQAAALAYPSLQRSDEKLQPLPQTDRQQNQKHVTVEMCDFQADTGSLLMRMKAAADSGAAVIFIRNRVDDAREAVLRLERIGAPLLRCRGVAAPHHGRFAPEDRRLLFLALRNTSRWTCSATPCGRPASTRSTSTTTTLPCCAARETAAYVQLDILISFSCCLTSGLPRRPAGTRQLLAGTPERRRARRLEARPPRPQPRPSGQHRAGPVGPRTRFPLPRARFVLATAAACAILAGNRKGQKGLTPSRHGRLAAARTTEGFADLHRRALPSSMRPFIPRGGTAPRPQGRYSVFLHESCRFPNKVEAADARSDLFERRRRLMADWSAYLDRERRPDDSERC